jgi:hypothetical protein
LALSALTLVVAVLVRRSTTFAARASVVLAAGAAAFLVV